MPASFAVMLDLMKQAYLNKQSLPYSDILKRRGMVVGALKERERRGIRYSFRLVARYK